MLFGLTHLSHLDKSHKISSFAILIIYSKHNNFPQKLLEGKQHFLMLVLREIYDYDKSLMPFFPTHTTKLQFFLPEKNEGNMYNHLLIVIIIRSVNGFGNEY